MDTKFFLSLTDVFWDQTEPDPMGYEALKAPSKWPAGPVAAADRVVTSVTWSLCIRPVKVFFFLSLSYGERNFL